MDRVIEEWQSAGIAPGDTVLLHSRLGRSLRRHAPLTPAQMLESLLQAVGEEGTLLLPLFNFDFCEGKAFDIRTTPSQMGVLTEAARLHPRALRTGHPVYSFAVIGKHAPAFAPLVNKNAYGADSPFALLHRLDGKIAILDLPDQHSMTFYHYVEESLRVPYRHDKEFTGPYTDAEGRTAQRSFQIYVRNIEQGVLTHVDPMGELLWERGCYKGERPLTGSGMRTIRAAELFDHTAAIIRAGKAEGLLYRIDKENAA